MLKSNIAFALSICLALMSASSQAVWWEASGSAPIIDGNLEKARKRATAEAIRNASLYAGTSISSSQTITNGILEEDNWNFHSNSEIRKTQVISEQKVGKQLTVTIRADIFAEASCAESRLSHSLTIARFPLAHRQQASHGSIYDVGGATSKALHGIFMQESQSVQSKLWLDEVVSYQPNKLTPSPEVDELARTLASRTNTQFVLLGQIRDISISNQQSTHFKFWTYEVKPRSLSLEVDLFDGISGEKLKSFHYQDRVSWDFPPAQRVDPYSADFWKSSYGQAWGYLLANVQRDVEATLSCQPSVAHITNRQAEGVIVNMGSQDGVKEGAQARLSRLGTFLDPFGRVKASIQSSDVIMTVKAVEAKQAFLVPQEPAQMAGVQNQDVVLFIAK